MVVIKVDANHTSNSILVTKQNNLKYRSSFGQFGSVKNFLWRVVGKGPGRLEKQYCDWSV